MLTIEDLGILRDVDGRRRRRASTVDDHADLLGLPGDGRDPRRRRRARSREAGYRRRRRADRARARLDHRLDQRATAAQARASTASRRPAPRRRGRPVGLALAVALPAVRLASTPASSRRFGSTAVQGAVALPRLPRAVRPLQGALMAAVTTSTQEQVAPAADAAFHPLRVAAVEQLTDDAVAVTFAVPARAARRVRTSRPASTSRCARRRRRGGAPQLLDLHARRRPGRLRIGDQAAAGRRVLRARARAAAGRRRARRDDARRPLRRPARPGATPSTTSAIAAGSGITPVLSILATVLETEPASRFTLVYANRDAGSVMFLEELADLKDRYPDRLQLRARALPRGAGRRAAAPAASTTSGSTGCSTRSSRPTTSTSGSCAGRSRWSSRSGRSWWPRACRTRRSHLELFHVEGSLSAPGRTAAASGCRGRRQRGDGAARRADARRSAMPPDGLRARRHARGAHRRAVRVQGRGLRDVPGEARRGGGRRWRAATPSTTTRWTRASCSPASRVPADALGRARLRRLTWSRPPFRRRAPRRS